MSIDLTQDYFSLFELPRAYAVDDRALEAAWHRLQSQVHPDRYAHLPSAQLKQLEQLVGRSSLVAD